MSKKVFTVGKSDPNSAPIQFELAGTNIQGEQIEPQTFTCLPEVQGEVLTDIIAAIKEDNIMGAVQITPFIRQCLVEEDVERFTKLTHSKDVLIQLELLGNIMMWLVEEYSSRPTAAPSGSPSGQTTTVPTSMGAGTLPDSTATETPSSNPLVAS